MSISSLSEKLSFNSVSSNIKSFSKKLKPRSLKDFKAKLKGSSPKNDVFQPGTKGNNEGVLGDSPAASSKNKVENYQIDLLSDFGSPEIDLFESVIGTKRPLEPDNSDLEKGNKELKQRIKKLKGELLDSKFEQRIKEIEEKILNSELKENSQKIEEVKIKAKDEKEELNSRIREVEKKLRDNLEKLIKKKEPESFPSRYVGSYRPGMAFLDSEIKRISQGIEELEKRVRHNLEGLKKKGKKASSEHDRPISGQDLTKYAKAGKSFFPSLGESAPRGANDFHSRNSSVDTEGLPSIRASLLDCKLGKTGLAIKTDDKDKVQAVVKAKSYPKAVWATSSEVYVPPKGSRRAIFKEDL